MNTEILKAKISCVISSTNTSGNQKLDAIMSIILESQAPAIVGDGVEEMIKALGTKPIDFVIDYHKINDSCSTLHLSTAFTSGFVDGYKSAAQQPIKSVSDFNLLREAAQKYYWEQKSKKRTMGVYHAVEDFKAGWKASQEQPIKSVEEDNWKNHVTLGQPIKSVEQEEIKSADSYGNG